MAARASKTTAEILAAQAELQEELKAIPAADLLTEMDGLLGAEDFQRTLNSIAGIAKVLPPTPLQNSVSALLQTVASMAQQVDAARNALVAQAASEKSAG